MNDYALRRRRLMRRMLAASKPIPASERAEVDDINNAPERQYEH